MSWASKLAEESGLTSLSQSCRDTKILCIQRFVRLFGYGLTFLILVQFLSSLGFPDGKIGVFMTATLLGDTVISFVLTSTTDRLGRRFVLKVGALLMAASGIFFFLTETYWLLLLASVVGVISPSGNEIGPFRAVEESVLAQLTEKQLRSDIFAWYTLFGTAGAALGALVCGWLVQAMTDSQSGSHSRGYKTVFLIYAALGLVKFVLVLYLSSSVELESTVTQDYEAVSTEPERAEDVELDVEDEVHEATESRLGPPKSAQSSTMKLISRVRSFVPYISPASRSILVRLLSLFFLDSFASGMASPSWLTYFFTSVHSMAPSTLGTLFLVTNILASVSNLCALPLARRLGPLKTMCFTHLPSAICLCLIALPPPTGLGTWLSMMFLVLRSCTQSMDQAPRQAFLAAAVLPEERTAVMGVVNVMKTLAQAGGVGTAGILAGAGLWVVELGGAGLMKATYDLLLLWMFLGLREREDERTTV